MENFIPKIQYRNITIEGDTTSGDPDITNLDTVVGLYVGMIVDHANFPAGSKITAIGVLQVTVDNNATATSSNVNIDFYNEIVFDYPPVDDDGEDITVVNKVDKSLSGVKQVQTQYTLFTRDIKYRFLTKVLHDLLKDFFEDHGGLGYSFRYFVHESESEYTVYSLADYKFKPKKILPKNGDFLYELPVKFERVES